MYIPNNLPKKIQLNLPQVKEILKVSFTGLLSENLYEYLEPHLVSELCYRLIADSPTDPIFYDMENQYAILGIGLDFDNYVKTMNQIYKYYLSNVVSRLEAIRLTWLEHNTPKLEWGYDMNDNFVNVYFIPTNPEIDIDAAVEQMIDKLQELGKPIPYKYLRVLGRL